MSSSKLSEGDTPSLDVSMSAANTSNPPSVESLNVSSGQSQKYNIKADNDVYHEYCIRKTASILKECIARKIPFRREYVKLSVQFQKEIESMSLPDIEVLHMKCQQALGGEISASDSDEGEGEEATFLLRKTKKAKHFHNPPVPTCMQNPGYYQQSVNPVYQSQYYGYYNPQEQQPGPVHSHQHGEAFARGFTFAQRTSVPSPIQHASQQMMYRPNLSSTPKPQTIEVNFRNLYFWITLSQI